MSTVFADIDSMSVVSTVPEPATAALLCADLLFVARATRRCAN